MGKMIFWEPETAQGTLFWDRPKEQQMGMAQNSKPKKLILLTPKLDDFRFISTRSLDPYPNEATHQNPISTLVFAYYSLLVALDVHPHTRNHGVFECFWAIPMFDVQPHIDPPASRQSSRIFPSA